MTDPRRIAHAINPKPFAYPADPDDPLGPSILKEAEEERQETIRRAEYVADIVLTEAMSLFDKDETLSGCVVLHRLEKLRGKSDG